jgi:S-adenosylmethionine:tRNA ribosyltransferase-isomerase
VTGGLGSPLGEYDYDLPDEAIAQDPAEPRQSARLLVAVDRAAPPAHRHVEDLPELLRPGDVLVVNDSRVIPARLRLRKATGAQVEVLLLAPAEPGGQGEWEALVRPGRRVPPGTSLYLPDHPIQPAGPAPAPGQGPAAAHDAGVPVAGKPVVEVGAPLAGRAGGRSEGVRLVRLLDETLPARHGAVPLPPYIHKTLRDPGRYQTVYARRPGSVAAPTAGLHFTTDLLARCAAAGAQLATVDLAVGLGTFRPITAARVEEHVMHPERYAVPAATWEACREASRVIAVGTTTLRALETVAAGGPPEGTTELFVHGDYPWRAVDVLLTNFHQPRSSLLVLLAAFAGPRWRELYQEALAAGYRFLSFGDAMIVTRHDGGRSGEGER